MPATLSPRRVAPVFVALAVLMLGTAACTLEPVAAERELVRDLTTVEPTEVGIDPERLRRLDAGMQAMVDDGKLAGLVTLLARHGKLVCVSVTGSRMSKHKPQ